MWKTFEMVESPPHYLLPSDVCYYAREYVSKGDFKASKTNNLIKNFKIDVSHRAEKRWYYKEQAAQQFASELAVLLDIKGDVFIAAIPSSKRRDADDHDPRFDMMFQTLRSLRKNVHIIRPIGRRVSCQSVHSQDERPSIAARRDSLEWLGVPNNIPHIVFIDDVITTGATFKAVSPSSPRMIRRLRLPARSGRERFAQRSDARCRRHGFHPSYRRVVSS